MTQSIFTFPSIATIESAFGGIPQSLPSLQIPQNITFEWIYLLLPSAFAIVMLCAIESLLAALITDRLTGQKHSADQELIGHGIANAVSPLFGGIASAGSIARTAASMRAGGNSPLAGIVSSFALTGFICFFAPLANNAPLATLSTIIFMVAFNMLRPRSVIALIRRSPKLDILTLLITCALTLVYEIVFALNVGVVLSALVLMYRLSISTRSISNVDKFEQLLDQMQLNTRALVLNFANVPFIDTARLQALSTFVKELKNKNKQFYFLLRPACRSFKS